MRLVLAVTIAFAVVAGLPDPRLTAQQSSVVLDIRDFSFEPRELMVPADTTTRWVNRDDFPHAIVMASNPSGSSRGNIAPGGEHTFVFRQPGRFTYRCGVHPTMLGEIFVSGQ